MELQKTKLSGVVILTPKRHGDARGFFAETWNRRQMLAAGIDVDFVQDNQSLSAQTGTIRGLHFQTAPHAQIKLVRCVRGALFDVAVDIRRGSPTYGQWIGEELTPENGRQLLIPAGFAHGFVTRRPDTEIAYKCSDYYAPECDGGIRWDSCGIDWGFDGTPVLSAKDSTAPALADFNSPFTWKAAISGRTEP